MKTRLDIIAPLVVVLVISAGRVCPAAAESLPDGRKLVGIEAHPESIELTTRLDYAQVLLTGTLDNGERVDVTRMASVTGGADIVSVSETRIVRPASDGKGALAFAVDGVTVSVPVVVSGQKSPYTVSYIRDVMPAISRIGCNTGTCHGAAKGKNGFKMSLRGYDPLADHRALTDDLKGRRFNRASPDKSLFLMKVSGRVPHEGGVQARPGEPYYDLLRTWVADGVQIDLDSPRVVSIETIPSSSELALPGMRQQLKVLATFSDGAVRDVTAEAFVETSDKDVATVDEHGILTAVRRGEGSALVRYEGRYAATGFLVMGDRAGFEWKDVPTSNYIDEFVYKKLRDIKSQPSELCTDAEFMRRVLLDLTGLPPTARDVRIFLSDTRESAFKRTELIDRHIGSSEFVEHWTNKWSDLLQVNGKFLGRDGAVVFREWIRGAVASNMPYNKFVHQILGSSGSTVKNPPTAYYKILRQADLVMENTTQLFLGIRFSCNKCHDHPFERWTQKNHWELAAFFAQIERKDAPGSKKMPRRSATQTAIPAFEEIISDKNEGEVSYPTGGQAKASFPYEYDGGVPGEGSRREMLVRWVTSSKNPYFARSFVNRTWSYLLGVGFIEPVDDIRAGNPPSNPELLDRLTMDFVDSGFDVRKLIRLICRSRVYQHSIRTNRWNKDDEVNFSHALARRLPAETLYDAIHRVTGTVSHLPGTRRGTRAAELADPNIKVPDGFLDLFGRPPRESACECERSGGMSLGQALTLVNGPTVARAVNDPDNSLGDLVDVEADNGKVVEELFLAILNRYPTDDERKGLVAPFDHQNYASVDALNPENTKKLASRLAAFEKKQTLVDWTAIESGIHRSTGGATLTKNSDASVIVAGTEAEKDTFTIVAWTDLTGITGFRLEALPDPSLGDKGPGRNGNFVLSEFIVTAAPATDPVKVKAVALQNPTATFSQKDFDVNRAIDGKRDDKGWAIQPQVGRGHLAVFEAKEDVGFPGGTILTFTLDHQHPKQALGKFRLSLTTTKRPVRVQTLPGNIVAVLRTPAQKRSPEQTAALYTHFIARDPEMTRDVRLNLAQDLTWALLNNPAFLFNR